jgi:hypothetical protein
MDKYQDWSKVLIEPATMNDARLFSLESRMHEEEEIRIKEYEFVRDLLKKLIYSLEKTSVTSIDGIMGSVGLPGNKSTDTFGGNTSSSPIHKSTGLQSKSQTPMLPNLLNNISLQNNSIRDMTILGKQNLSINESLLSAGKSYN